MEKEIVIVVLLDMIIGIVWEPWKVLQDQFEFEIGVVQSCSIICLQKIHPFRWSWILYALAGLLMLFFQKKSFYHRLGWFFAGTGFFIQCMGLLSRVLIAGRPPVTNMYESMIWVAFGTVLFAL